MTGSTGEAITVIGADLLAEAGHPCVFWVLDGTASAVRRGLRAAGRPRTGREGRLRVVTPAVGLRPQRRGPSVALLVDDPVLAADHLAQLLPVPVVPVWFGGAHLPGPIRMRVGPVLRQRAGETTTQFTDRVADAGDDLAREESAGWWQVITERAGAGASAAAGAAAVAPVPVTPGGWRQRWSRSEPVARRPGIWR